MKGKRQGQEALGWGLWVRVEVETEEMLLHDCCTHSAELHLASSNGQGKSVRTPILLLSSLNLERASAPVYPLSCLASLQGSGVLVWFDFIAPTPKKMPSCS